MINVMLERSILKDKIQSGNITPVDLQTAAAIARATTALVDRVAFAKVRQFLANKPEDDAPTDDVPADEAE